MDWVLDRLKAGERRVIAGRVGGLLWLFAAIATPLLTLLPHVEVERPGVTAVLAVSAGIWGVVAAAVLDWRRVPASVIDIATAVAVAYTATMIFTTGGTESPARLYVLLVLVYATGFLTQARAAITIGACAAVYAAPAGLAEFAFTAPIFFIVGGVLLAGRSLLTGQALTDPLTGLPNHRAFQERLHAEVGRARRHGRPLTLAMIDLDNFKQINDLAGHAMGDRVLGELGVRLRASLRDEDLLARIGGDEFALLLPETGETAAHAVLERIRQLLEREPLVDGIRVTISAGICGIERAQDTESILRLADGALYWSKEQGRNVTYIYDPETVRELSASERLVRLQRSQGLAGIRALARAIDAKDPSTREHSERVAALAARLAHARGWTADRVALLHEAALVHDVGKIGVPDAVLLKPGRLDAGEYELVKLHAALSAQIVEAILIPEQVEWIRAHHERPDGRGYPDGLREIAEGAALLAAADCFDVMTVARPYSKAKSEAEALAECRSLVGAQFTAEAVEALVCVSSPGLQAAA